MKKIWDSINRKVFKLLELRIREYQRGRKYIQRGNNRKFFNPRIRFMPDSQILVHHISQDIILPNSPRSKIKELFSRQQEKMNE